MCDDDTRRVSTRVGRASDPRPQEILPEWLPHGVAAPGQIGDMVVYARRGERSGLGTEMPNLTRNDGGGFQVFRTDSLLIVGRAVQCGKCCQNTE
jgi:hypothetical protein